MIVLHRLTHPDQPFYLNPDLIQTVEATPDTVLTLGNAHKLVVIETPDEVAHSVREWRASIIACATNPRLALA
jgi:flagellar protein FlbD